MTSPSVVIRVVEAGRFELPGLADGGSAEVKLDDDVALELVEVDGAVVDHLTCSRPRMGEPVGGEVVRRHKVVHRLVLPHEAVVMVAIHVPDLRIVRKKED